MINKEQNANENCVQGTKEEKVLRRKIDEEKGRKQQNEFSEVRKSHWTLPEGSKENENVHQVQILSEAKNSKLQNSASQQDKSTNSAQRTKENNPSPISQLSKEPNHEQEHHQGSISKSSNTNLRDFGSQQVKSKEPNDEILEQSIVLDTNNRDRYDIQEISQEREGHTHLRRDLEFASTSDEKPDVLLMQELRPMAILGFTKQLIKQEQKGKNGQPNIAQEKENPRK